jgi:hypothetical protein
MRAAQIGGDGVLRDASGFSYADGYSRKTRPAQQARPIQPNRPTPKQMPIAPRFMSNAAPKRGIGRNSGGMFGLGQAEPPTDPRLRQIVEGKLFPDVPSRPVSSYEFIPSAIATTDYNKKLISGRYVFCRSDADPAAAAQAGVDVSGVYMISARPATTGQVALMKIVGDSALWVNIPEAFFKANFFVSSISALYNINALYPSFNPMLDGKTSDPLRVSSGWVRALGLVAYRTTLGGYLPSDLLDKATQKANVKDIAARLMTAMGYLQEALICAASGFDTNYIGYKAFIVLAETIAAMMRSSINFYNLIVEAIKTDNQNDYAKVAAFYFRYIGNGPLWGESLHRGNIWTLVTVSSATAVNEITTDAYLSSAPFVKAYKERVGEVAQKAGVTIEQAKDYIKPLEDFTSNYFIDKATDELELDKALGSIGLGKEEYSASYGYFSDLLVSNEKVLREINRLGSVNAVLDPGVYQAFADLGRLGASALPGPKPVVKPREIPMDAHKLNTINNERLTEYGEKLLTLTDAERARHHDRARAQGFKSVASDIERILEPAEAHLVKDLPKEIAENPKQYLEYLNQRKAGGLINETMYRSLSSYADNGVLSKRQSVIGARNELATLTTLAQTDPVLATQKALELRDRGQAYALREVSGPPSIERMTVSALKFDRAFGHTIQTVVTAEHFRARILTEFGPGKAPEMEAVVLSQLNRMIDAGKKELAQGKWDVVANKNEPLTADQKVKIESSIKQIEHFRDLFDLAGEGKKADLLHQYFMEAVTKRDVVQGSSAGVQLVNSIVLQIGTYEKELAQFVTPEGKLLPDLQRALELEIAGERLSVVNPKYKERSDAFIRAVNALQVAAGKLKELNRPYKDKEPSAREEAIFRNQLLWKTTMKEFADAFIYVKKAREILEASSVSWQNYSLVLKLTWTPIKTIVLMGYVWPGAIRNKLIKSNKIIGVMFSPFEGAAYIVWSYILITVLYKITAIVNLVPGIKEARGGWERLHNFWTKGKNPFDPNRNDVQLPGSKFREGLPGSTSLGVWEIAGFGLLAATLVAPHKVIPGITRLVKTVVGGVSSIFGGGKGRGRPALGKKRPIAGPGAGAPPDLNKAIEEIKKGQKEGNPFLVKKGFDKLKRLKEMGLPVPKGYIDGLSWGF